jgi:6-phosphogluconolactonase/glucosamine-6-phosphate isomerase/deaminase
MAVAVPRFDVLMLGVGPDSHVASLFPGRDELSVRDRATVAVTESPKPPPLRVSLTLPALLQARATWLLVGGKDKADAVAASIATSDDPGHPASWVRGTEDTTWWLDEEAAAQLRK